MQHRLLSGVLIDYDDVPNAPNNFSARCDCTFFHTYTQTPITGQNNYAKVKKINAFIIFPFFLNDFMVSFSHLFRNNTQTFFFLALFWRVRGENKVVYKFVFLFYKHASTRLTHRKHIIELRSRKNIFFLQFFFFHRQKWDFLFNKNNINIISPKLVCAFYKENKVFFFVNPKFV